MAYRNTEHPAWFPHPEADWQHAQQHNTQKYFLIIPSGYVSKTLPKASKWEVRAVRPLKIQSPKATRVIFHPFLKFKDSSPNRALPDSTVGLGHLNM